MPQALSHRLRRKLLSLSGLFMSIILIWLVLFSTLIQAQTYPSKPITVVSPFAPGGPSDLIARTMAIKLSEGLGVPVVVENRGGAGATIGTSIVARANPDGYTLLLAGQSSLAFAPHLYPKLSYDPLRDFSPISNVALAPYALVVSSRIDVKNIAELLKLARSKPQGLTYATSGAGSVSHLATAMLISASGTDLLHVPYKGMIPAVGAVLSGDVDMVFADLGSVEVHIRAGKLRLLAVSGRTRASLVPNVPTMIESGFKDLVAEGRFGFLAPAGTPREIVMRLHGILATASQSTDVRERFANISYEPTSDTPDQFMTLIKSDHERFGRLIRQLKITTD
jgi:tripartite-type tricarboxylate transporter receptor subunit TctC